MKNLTCILLTSILTIGCGMTGAGALAPDHQGLAELRVDAFNVTRVAVEVAGESHDLVVNS